MTKDSDLVSFDELEKASKRIGTCPQAQLQWALKLANEDTATSGAGRKLDLRVEVPFFLGGPRVLGLFRKDATRSINSVWFPSDKQLTDIHKSFTGVLVNYVEQKEAHIRTAGQTNFYLHGGQFDFVVEDMVEGSVVKLMKLIGEFSQHVRRCASAECGKWFLGKKTDAAYCSKTCGTRERSRELRRRRAKKGEKRRGTRKTR